MSAVAIAGGPDEQASTEPLLRAEGVFKSFGQTEALDNASISISAGEVVAIMGPSGSGKSTLLHCAAGIIKPDSGSVRFAGRELTTMSDTERSSLRRSEFGFVFQFGQLVPELSCLENVALPLRLQRAADHAEGHGGAAANPKGYVALYLEPSGIGVRAGSDLIEHVRNAVRLEPNVHFGLSEYSYGTRDEQTFASIRASIYAGSTIVLVLAALSVLVLAVEQVRERRRALAAVAASGIGFGTLARSLLWQNAIPLGVGVVFALLGGILLAHFVLRIPGLPLVIDWSAVGGVVAMAVASVLFVTLLSLPVLRAAVSVKNLRTE